MIPILLDTDGAVTRRYGVIATPTSFTRGGAMRAWVRVGALAAFTTWQPAPSGKCL